MADPDNARRTSSIPPHDEPVAGPTVRSRPLSPDKAHDLVLDLERQGVETDKIGVDTAAPRTVAEVSAVDNATVRRQGRRVAVGAVAGAAVGVALALIALAVADGLRWPPTVITAALVGTLLGALVSLYAGLEASTEVDDVDSGGPTVIETRVADMGQGKADDVRRRTDRSAE